MATVFDEFNSTATFDVSGGVTTLTLSETDGVDNAVNVRITGSAGTATLTLTHLGCAVLKRGLAVALEAM